MLSQSCLACKMKNQKKQKINNFVFKYLKQKIKALQAVQNSNVNYTHVETPKVHNDNNHKQFKSQEAKQARPTVHTHIHSHAHTSTQAPTHMQHPFYPSSAYFDKVENDNWRTIALQNLVEVATSHSGIWVSLIHWKQTIKHDMIWQQTENS